MYVGNLDPNTEPLALRDESHKEEGKDEIKEKSTSEKLRPNNVEVYKFVQDVDDEWNK